MKRSCGSFLVIMFVVSFTSAHAATYTWTDAQGTVHFTEDPGAVPAQLRNNVRTMDESEPAPPSPAVAKPVDPGQKGANKEVSPPVNTGALDGPDLYGGKTAEQWQKEIVDKEAAMTAVRNRIEEIVNEFKLYGPQWNLQAKLVAEYNALTAKFKEMKSQYDQLMESARNAGLEVNIQQ